MGAKGITLYFLASTVAGLMAIGLVGAQVMLRYPVNHGFDAWQVGWVLVPTAGAVFAPFAIKSRWRFVPTLVWVTLLCGLIVVDSFNMLVEHSVWGPRGLPGWGEFRIEKVDPGVR
jgi:hypothetical protein